MNCRTLQSSGNLYKTVENTRDLILLAYFQYIFCENKILLFGQIFFPKNYSLRVKAAYPIYLFHERAGTEMAIGHSDYR